MTVNLGGKHPKAEMTPKCLGLLFLMGLLIIPILSQDCVNLSDILINNIKLLSNMIGSPVKCLRENRTFKFPREILLFIQPMESYIKDTFCEISIQALNIFNCYIANSTLEKKNLEEIQRGLAQQVENAMQCLEEEKNEKKKRRMSVLEEEDLRLGHWGDRVLQWIHLKLSNYFIRIKKFLSEKKFSPCAWKIIGVEIKRCFLFFHEFTELLTTKSDGIRELFTGHLGSLETMQFEDWGRELTMGMQFSGRTLASGPTFNPKTAKRGQEGGGGRRGGERTGQKAELSCQYRLTVWTRGASQNQRSF